jgi:hypothetical protein
MQKVLILLAAELQHCIACPPFNEVHGARQTKMSGVTITRRINNRTRKPISKNSQTNMNKINGELNCLKYLKGTHTLSRQSYRRNVMCSMTSLVW